MMSPSAALIGGVGALLTFFGLGMAPFSAAEKPLAACAASSADGTAAAVTVDASGMALELTDASGQVRHLADSWKYFSPPPRIVAAPCDVYFDERSDLVAIGFSDSDGVRISVAEISQPVWLGRWHVGGPPALHFPLLAGFLEDTNSVMVVGRLSSDDKQGSMSIELFDPLGRVMTGMSTTRTYARTDINPYADARHNRLWIVTCEALPKPTSQYPPCPIRSVTLTGDESGSGELTPSLSIVKRADLWFLPTAIAAVDRNTALLAEGNRFWRVDLDAQTIDTVILPLRSHFPHLHALTKPIAISPDGEIAAVTMNESALAFPYLVDNYADNGREIAVVQIRPLKVLSVFRNEALPFGLAVDHRAGEITLVMYGREQWGRHQLVIPSQN